MPSHSRLTSVVALTSLALALAVTSAGCAARPRTSPPHQGQQRPGQQHAAVTAKRQHAEGPKPVWLQQLSMVTSRAGWALAWSGNPGRDSSTLTLGLLHTTDGGRTWASVTPPAAGPLITPLNSYEIEYPKSASTAWFGVTKATAETSTAINSTRLFETTDGGRTWTASALIRAPGTVGTLTFAGPTDGWLILQLGEAMNQDQVTVYKSTDAGRRWSLAARTLPPPTPGTSASGVPTYCDKTGISFATASTGFITAECPLGLTDTLLISTDGGRHWSPDPLPVPAGACQQSQCEVSSPRFFGRIGYITLGQYPGPGFLLTTQNAGATWSTVPLPPGNDPYPQATFYDATTGTVLPAGPQQSHPGVFYLTRDGGLTWRFTRQGGSTKPSGAIEFVSPERGFGWNMNAQPPAIYTTANGGRSWTRFRPLS
jgi:photosystem II stability/assembly factor-like uncharacterized protein